MSDRVQQVVILLADDDPDDREMTRRALDRNNLADDFYTVGDGEELLDFLRHRGKYAPPALSPTPGLILLDLNKPPTLNRARRGDQRARKILVPDAAAIAVN